MRSFSRRGFPATVGKVLVALTLMAGSPLAFGQGTGLVSRFGTAEEESRNLQIVNEFCAAWATKDVDKIASIVADNITFRYSQRQQPSVGKDKLLERLREGFKTSNFELRIVKAVVMGPVVLTQRDDKIIPVSGDAAQRRFNIAAGMFFVENGKITEWTDYQIYPQ